MINQLKFRILRTHLNLIDLVLFTATIEVTSSFPIQLRIKIPTWKITQTAFVKISMNPIFSEDFRRVVSEFRGRSKITQRLRRGEFKDIRFCLGKTFQIP